MGRWYLVGSARWLYLERLLRVRFYWNYFTAAMDPALVRQREAFKKRALAVPVVETKPSESKRESSKERPAKQPKQKKKKSKFSRPKPQPLPG